MRRRRVEKERVKRFGCEENIYENVIYEDVRMKPIISYIYFLNSKRRKTPDPLEEPRVSHNAQAPPKFKSRQLSRSGRGEYVHPLAYNTVLSVVHIQSHVYPGPQEPLDPNYWERVSQRQSHIAY